MTAPPALKKPNAPPPGWGSDSLSAFWEAARLNQFGTFVNKRPIYERLVAIDDAFARVSGGLLNPASEISTMLFLRCHAAYRAAAGLAAAGQAVEAYVMNRSALESAAYALQVYRNPDLGMVWLNRHEDEASMEASRSAFSHRKVHATVTAANRHAGERFEGLYQRAIDWGGHPNERSVTGNMNIIEEPDRRVMLAIFQHGDGPALDMILKTTAQCGVCCLEISQNIFNARFEILGINAAMLELQKGL